MNNTKTIEIYRETEIAFRSDAWVNATQMAKPFGKLPASFTRTESAKAFITALENELRENLAVEKSSMQKCIVVQNGGACPGTWMHPDLALEFARWLSPDFAIWCNRTIRRIMAGGAGTSNEGAILAAMQAITVTQEKLIGVVETLTKANAASEEFSRRLTLGHHNLQTRIEALEAANRQQAGAPSPRLRLLPTPRPDALAHLIEIDRILFTAESADWWVGTASMLRRRLAEDGLHIRQLGLEALSKNKAKRCLNLRNVARGTQRVYAILRPGSNPDSLTMSLICQQVRNLRAA